MSKIAIFKSDRPNETSSAYKTYKRLQAEGPDTYYLEAYADMAFFIRDGKVECVSVTSGRSVDDYDLLYLRDLGHPPIRHAVAEYAKHKKIRVLSEESGYFQHETKLTQYVSLALNGVAVPDTVFAVKPHVAAAAAKYGMTYPAVAKAIAGSNGRDNVLVHNESGLHDLPFSHAVVQPFIPNDFDYRVIVAGGDVMLAYKRIRSKSGGHKNNVAEGAVREAVHDIPEELRDIAVRASEVLRRDLSGVDVVQNSQTGKYYILEVNANFGMTDLPDGISGQYIPRLADYLRKCASE